MQRKVMLRHKVDRRRLGPGKMYQHEVEQLAMLGLGHNKWLRLHRANKLYYRLPRSKKVGIRRNGPALPLEI
eukprot:1108660-Pyramimonas_sp.AAC.1